MLEKRESRKEQQWTDDRQIAGRVECADNKARRHESCEHGESSKRKKVMSQATYTLAQHKTPCKHSKSALKLSAVEVEA
jgi:hypothetical protein